MSVKTRSKNRLKIFFKIQKIRQPICYSSVKFFQKVVKRLTNFKSIGIHEYMGESRKIVPVSFNKEQWDFLSPKLPPYVNMSKMVREFLLEKFGYYKEKENNKAEEK